MFFPMIWMFCIIVTHYNNELGEVVEYEMLDPPIAMFGWNDATVQNVQNVQEHITDIDPCTRMTPEKYVTIGLYALTRMWFVSTVLLSGLRL